MEHNIQPIQSSPLPTHSLAVPPTKKDHTPEEAKIQLVGTSTLREASRSFENLQVQNPKEIARPPIEEPRIENEAIFEEIAQEFQEGTEPSLSSKSLKRSISLDQAHQIGIDLKDAEKIIDKFVLSQKEAFVKENGEEALKGKNEIEVIKAWLGSTERMDRNAKPRLEIRLVPNTSVIANIALSFPNTEIRDGMFKHLQSESELSNVSFVSAGTTTIEIGTKDVDKATTINYVTNHFEELLQQMEYQPGDLIDAKSSHSVIIADADGTLWDPPIKDKPPDATHLGNSPAKESILNYLRAGGVLIVNSGNDPRRTVNRILKGIPELERKELLSRIAIAAAGGHTLMTLNSEGHIREVPGYRENALKEQREKSSKPSERLDVLYIGDDGKVKGNDFPAFLKVGPGHYICVPHREKLGEVDPSLKESVVVGEAATVAQIFRAVVDKALIHPQKEIKNPPPLFSDIPAYISLASSLPPAKELIDKTLKLCGGREGVDKLIAYNDQLNGPVRYEKQEIDQYIQAFDHSVRQQFTTLDSTTKKKVTLNYEGLLTLNHAFTHELSEKSIDIQSLYNHFKGVKSESFEDFMQEALDRMQLKDGDTIRLLEPGNNDQATPMFVAQQIKFINEYAAKRQIRLSTQVLIMGRGGHATTSLFPQIGELKGSAFSGVPEAVSLGGTLVEALNQLKIPSQVVDKFDPANVENVQIKLAKTSTNTGENVKEALECDSSETSRPQHVFVCAARTAATRQALTFAQQYAEDKANPLSKKAYESITAIPYFRSEKFIHEALNDHQAVTELYAGLAEQCRSFLYAFNPDKPFIPPSPIDVERLDHLYKAYDLLSGTNNLEESKKKSVQNLLDFFSARFTEMEKSIPWSKESDFQKLATDQSVKMLMEREIHKEEFARSLNDFKLLLNQKHLLTKDQQRLLVVYGLLHRKMTNPELKDNRTKLACAIMMGQLGKRFQDILKEIRKQ
jgi:hypothetical protein